MALTFLAEPRTKKMAGETARLSGETLNFEPPALYAPVELFSVRSIRF